MPRSMDSGASGNDHVKKKRIVSCGKVLLDVAKESADWFPPLKAALGGVNALIKHFEEFEDVKEKIQELSSQLGRLKENIKVTQAAGDLEEETRRGVLVGGLEQIEKESKDLLKKNAAAGFVDKGEDSKLVAGYIERLREAILRYQMSQQQSIYRQITHLTSSFDTLLKLREKPPAVRTKLESIMAKLNSLEDHPRNEFQHEQWEKLCDGLRPISDEAKGLYDRMTAEGYTDDEGDILAVSRVAQQLQDVLLEYQMAQQQAIYEKACSLIDAADLSVLNNCRRAQGAEYRHGDRRGCLKGTRETVLSEIESWAKDFATSPVFWLNGLAGTGKSTVAQTIAERIFAEGLLGASFFCSRHFEDRSNLSFIFPTISFQLAHKYTGFRSYLVSLLRSNPDIIHEPLYNQMQKLIAEPLRVTGISTVIVIDALDECKDDEPSSAILSVLGRFVGKNPKVKFFITGRPEPRVKSGFRLPLLGDFTDVFVLHDVPLSSVTNDIRVFLKHELSKIAQRRQLGQWPSDEHVDLLCRRAAGLFVYAVATVKFLDSNIHLPKNQLDEILEFPASTVPEGKTEFTSNTTLDFLYTSILKVAIREGFPDVDSKVRTIIGAIVFVVNPLTPPAIAELMDLELDEVELYLEKVQSLLSIGENPDQPVKPFHKSFPDFITDPSRCVNPRFRISPERLHCELVTNCLRLMNHGLEKDLLSLPGYVLNSEVKDLQSRINNRVSSALQYACRSWHNHLNTSGSNITNVTADLRTFLENNFLAWLEVLSVLGDVGGAAVGLEKLMTWLQEVSPQDDSLLDTARDCFNFVTKYFEPINVSATHIYHSALELCPISSTVRGLYYQRYRSGTCSPRVVVGAPDSWDQAVSFSNKDHEYVFCIWSPCGRFIAAQTPKTVDIRDQLTSELLTILQIPETIPRLTGPLAYSPDGRSLACASDTSIVVWDIQTGGVAEEICRGPGTVSMAWSLDGSTIGFIDSKGCVHRHDFDSGKTSSPGEFSSKNKLCLGAHEKSFRILVTAPIHFDSATVEVFDIGPPLTKIGSSRLSFGTTEVQCAPDISYSPTTGRFAISVDNELRIFDDQNSCTCFPGANPILSHHFSPDGSLLAAVTKDGIRVWKYASGNYMQWKELRCRGWTHSLQFSPSQLSILGNFGGILHGWRLHDIPSTPKSGRVRWTGLSHCGSYIATAYQSEATVTITDLNLQAPPRLINTGVEIEGLVLTGNILLVLGSGTVVAWLLTEGELVDGVVSDRVRPCASVWTISLPYPTFSPGFTVEGHIGIIALGGNPPKHFIYDTKTGDTLQPDQAPQTFGGSWNSLRQRFRGRDYFALHNLSQCNAPPEGGWQTTNIAACDGWVKDPEGGHRLWLPVEWRACWDPADWRHDIATQFSSLGGELVVVKF